ncbi:MAG: molybdopterin-synthase adenylyltransferase MoeB [Verrucomicrobia bacterium]|nr:molybdopterin-synthase adenylyltransferase MoeB [Verrucomicrobiota bacterium]
MAEPSSLSPAELARYSRHVLLGEVGVAGQQKLAAARVLVVGAGGLGSPAALYLAAAGVGTIGLADFDRVAAHNLQRQLLHDDSTVGQPKVSSGAARLRATNPFIRVVEHPEGVTPENAVALFGAYDIVVDGTDNFSARYLNNDAAVLARRPLVFGSVFKFEGQVSVFAPHLGGPCYRCIFPEPPAPGSVPGCGEAGVLGALCGVIGSLQAVEVLKLIVGAGEPLLGRLLTYDGLAQNFRVLALKRDRACPACGEHPPIRAIDPARYRDTCQPSTPAAEPEEVPWEISVTEAKHQLDHASARTLLLDVRESYEWQICHVAHAEHIPMRQIPERLGDLPRDRRLLVICHSGVRSLRVTEFLRANGFTAVSNVAGGIDAWAAQIDPTMPRY